MSYLLDANVFISAKNLHYGLDFCPAFWDWAMGQQYTPAAVNQFLQAADFYLVAHALAGQHIVVSNEVISPSPNRIKIPNACIGLGVRFMSPYQMLRIERARFVLEMAA